MLREIEKEELLRLQINELAKRIQELNNRRDFLIGQSVAIETAGMGYREEKAFSLGIRWYSCKDRSSFNEGYWGWRSSAPQPVAETPQAGA